VLTNIGAPAMNPKLAVSATYLSYYSDLVITAVGTNDFIYMTYSANPIDPTSWA